MRMGHTIIRRFGCQVALIVGCLVFIATSALVKTPGAAIPTEGDKTFGLASELRRSDWSRTTPSVPA